MRADAYLVTGATGFVGRHLLEALAADGGGRRVLALVRDPEAWRDLDWTGALEGRVEPVVGSVTEPDGFAGDLPPLAGIFHLAALVRHSRRDPEEVYATNVGGGLAMVRLAADHACRLVMVSTSGTVGCFRTPHERADEKSPHCTAAVRRWPYYDSKVRLETRARALADELGVELVLIRPPVLLGPGDHRFRSTSNVLRFLRGKLPFLIRGGMHFADVRDAAGAVHAAMTRSEPKPVYHLEGTECGIVEFFEMLESVSGVPRPRAVLPFRPAWLLARATERWGLLPDPVILEMAARHWGARSLWAAGDLAYRSRPPHETLRDTVTWLRAHHPDL